MGRLEVVMWYERLAGTLGLLTVTVYGWNTGLFPNSQECMAEALSLTVHGVWLLEHWVISQQTAVVYYYYGWNNNTSRSHGSRCMAGTQEGLTVLYVYKW